MDWYERQIVLFVLEWIPFGGPPDDEVFPRFGLTPSEFSTRFREIVLKLNGTRPTLAEQDRDLLSSAVSALMSESGQSQHAAIYQDRLPRAALF